MAALKESAHESELRANSSEAKVPLPNRVGLTLLTLVERISSIWARGTGVQPHVASTLNSVR